MQLTMFAPVEVPPPQSSSGKTSLVSSRRATTPSGAFWLGLPEKMTRWSRQGAAYAACRRTGGWIVAYGCKFCGGHHIGHPPARVRQAIKARQRAAKGGC